MSEVQLRFEPLFHVLVIVGMRCRHTQEAVQNDERLICFIAALRDDEGVVELDGSGGGRDTPCCACCYVVIQLRKEVCTGSNHRGRDAAG